MHATVEAQERILVGHHRFALYNIRRIRPFLMREAAQLLVQALLISRLDYCNSLLAGRPASVIRPLQRIQNAAARLVFNLPKVSSSDLLARSSHPIQDNGTDLQGCQRHCPNLPPTPSISQTPRPSLSPPLNYLGRPAGTAIAKSKQRSHS
ncbi:hypothetical protein N1851_035256 [Merluccius polli]|uniref:Uncharacterized protein n=1 Tax=Merluccius polli TaxID=89951 RepID=A0AA47LYX4_MERPO|nr:hypothetical protein N1851_035256 [Merluccius polli]